MKTAKDLELSLLIKENTIQNLKLTNMHLQIKNNQLETKILEAIKMLEEGQKGLEEWHFDGYDPELKEVIKILRSEDDEI
ncbi:MAG: hypothetical protein J6T10_30825 [Methanobrevibacter sp.]|nr:hypothetical protein [Methanobrevibacter sp.]